MTPGRRLAGVVASGLVPWVVVHSAGSGSSVSLVFAFGLVSPLPVHVTPVTAYLLVLTRGLPQSLLAWPIAALLYAVALASAVAGWRLGREDRRVTGGLLVLAGASLLPVALAVGRPASITALPVGTVALWAVAWWGYGDALGRVILGGSTRGR